MLTFLMTVTIYVQERVGRNEKQKRKEGEEEERQSETD